MTLTSLPPNLFTIDPAELVPGDNIRTDLGDLDSLGQSIKANGLVEPILVRSVQVDGADRLQVVDGHRRHAAAVAAKVKEVTIRLVDATDNEATVVMLVTSLQKQNLNPMEEAVGFARLVQARQSLTALAKKVGRSKEYVSGRLALLSLPDDVQQGLRAGTVTLAAAGILVQMVEAGCRESVVELYVGLALDGRLTEHNLSGAKRAEGKARLIEGVQAKADRIGWPLYVVSGHEGLKDAVAVRASRPRMGIGNVDVDPEAHKKESCACFILDTYMFDEDTKPILGCSDPERHGKNGTSKLKPIDRSKEEPPAPTPAPLPPELEAASEEEQAAYRAEQDRLAAEKAAQAEEARLAREAADAERERRSQIRAARRQAVADNATAKDVQGLVEDAVLALALDFVDGYVMRDLALDRAGIFTAYAKGGKERRRVLAVCATRLAYVAEDPESTAFLNQSFRAVADRLAEPDPDDVDRDNAEAADLEKLEDLWDRNRATQHGALPVFEPATGKHTCGVCHLVLHEQQELSDEEGVHLWGVEWDPSVPHLFAPDIDDRDPGDSFYCSGCGQKEDGELHDLTAVEDETPADLDAVSLGAPEVPTGPDGEPDWTDVPAADRESLGGPLTDEEADAFARLDTPEGDGFVPEPERFEHDGPFDEPVDYDGAPDPDDQPLALA